MKKRYRFLLAGAWLLLVTILFVLPGSALPKNRLLLGLGLDKFVHVGIFWGLLYLWSAAFFIERGSAYWSLLGAGLLYGFLVEVVQHTLIANRSFDLGDLTADLVGCGIGLLSWKLYRR